MKFDWAGTFGDAWRYWKRDRELLIPVVGLFLFVPQFALQLFLPPMPPLPASDANQAEVVKAADAIAGWLVGNGGWALLAAAVTLFGALTVFLLYLGAERFDLRQALRRGVGLFPRYLLAAIVVGLPTVPLVLGLLLLLLPCLYLMGRLAMVAPSLIAERPIAVSAAIKRSFALTRGRGLVMTGLVSMAVLAGLLVPAPFVLLRHALEMGHAANPVAVVTLDFIASILATIVATATILVEVSLYRRLSASSSGI